MMEGLGLEVWRDGETIQLNLPIGYTAEKIVHQKLGSAGTYDPLEMRERVVIKLKQQEW